MKISFAKSDLSNCLTMLNYVGRRNTLEILNGTLIEVENGTWGCGEATLIATDLETTVKTAAAVEVLDDTDMHKLCLPVKELRGMLKGVDRYERIVIEGKPDSKATVTIGSVTHTLKSFDFGEFPDVVASDGFVPAFEMDVDTFRDMLGSVSYATETEEFKYFLNGVYFELTTAQTRFVGTDGRRMAVANSDSVMSAETPPWRDNHAIVPNKAVEVVSKVFKKTAENHVKFGIFDKNGHDEIAFTDGVDWVYSRLVDGEYPKIDGVLEKYPPVGKRVVGNVSIMLDAVKQMMTVPFSASITNKKGTTIWAKIEPGKIEFLATNKDTKDTSSTTVAVDSNFSLEIGFEGKYMADALGSIKCDDVWMDFIDSDKAIIIKPEGGVGKLDLVMPKRKD